ncbi:glycine cleavage system aminomethyltransferase GcvT [Planctopirus hydrillae]|uniref:Aminomethyltransferase n=1 Tax=Planctopirus hydrillae TaxID=1841610 RepID=A0A1C3EQD8_9PLAN|nr:glycine cleavage system aminomethyltransferase GcvT [Planctopirus hydrillae]ODA35465.1 glycine cleavage system protein T [Planctopirus hydrillae]
MTLATPLCDWHSTHGGRMVDFAGWNMPVQYKGIVDEHNAVRTAAGLFDISHMGRLRFTGPDAREFLDEVQTVDLSKLKTGQIRYGFMLNESGGILDDILVYDWPDAPQLVVNASNREKLLAWMTPLATRYAVSIEDLTLTRAMLAVQGPHAIDIAAQLLGDEVRQLKYYTGKPMTWSNEPVLVSRTGYTGEDGVELIIDSGSAVALWQAVLAAGESVGILPSGLGCRDTLRLEAAMPLYGHELSEEIDPLSAGLSFAIKLSKAANFIGKTALEKIANGTIPRPRVGLALDGKRIAREKTAVVSGENVIGEVTSGTFSPTFQKSIAMAYVDAAFAEPGTRLEVDIRGKRESATIVPLPFYKRNS